MTKLLLLIFFTSFFSADRGIDWFYIQEGRVWHHQGEILTFPVDASSNLTYVSQYTQLGECEMCPYRSVFKNTIDTLLIEVGMINDFGDAEVEKSTLFYMNENLLIENNRKLSLISKSTENILKTRHILDSAQAIDFIDKSSKICADLGTGAGFPGIVLSILFKERKYPIRIDLYEKSPKKCQFLSKIVKKLDLNALVFEKKTSYIPFQRLSDYFYQGIQL